ncbi:MAG: hypothetical protein E7671_04865 [Ruminococcaceae bacterium]|nr:hypothetical protein [Oscillospiraceae bacterium]
MKQYENFDNNFFLKIICIIAGLVLVFVIAAAAVGLITADSSPADKEDDAETFVFGETQDKNDTSPAPIETEEDTAVPTVPESDTEAPEADDESSPVETEEITEEITTEEISEPDEPASTVLGETEDMGQEYIDSLIFLGDSTSYGLKAYKMLKDEKNTKQVWTTKTATLSLGDILTKKIVYPNTGKEMTIAEAAALAKPEYLVITLGIEGVTFLDEDAFKAQYTSLVEAVKVASPETKIMLQSIFPVASSFKTTDKLNNPLVDKANGWVLSIAENTGVRYLDTQSVLKDENGALNPKYDNGGNGINLNDTGFNAVLNYIRTHGYK